MANKQSPKNQKKKANLVLPIVAVCVVIVAIGVGTVLHFRSVENQETVNGTDTVVSGEADMSETDVAEAEGTDSQGTNAVTSQVTEDGLEIDVSDLGTDVQFIDYDSDGVDIQVMVVADKEGAVHVAYNTCQVCNGSPYAYFVQDGDSVICQNCGNRFAVSVIGNESFGCNPIPAVYEEDGTNIKISSAELDKYKDAFTNWKKGI